MRQLAEVFGAAAVTEVVEAEQVTEVVELSLAELTQVSGAGSRFDDANSGGPG